MNNDDMMIHNIAKMYGNSRLGYNAVILENVMLSYPDASVLEEIARMKKKVENHEYEGTVIGDSAAICPNSTILPGIDLGEGAMVAAEALVTKDVPA